VEWLQQRVVELGLAETVEIVNNLQTCKFTAEYLSLLRQHDVVLAPSIRSTTGDDEGGPALTLIMAQSAGKPVIVSDFPGSERSVSDGEQGLVVPMGDVDALRKAMAEMVGNHTLWRQLGSAGRNRVVNDFSDKSYWASLEDWYREAVLV
jgi:glycosyltransferase involved in cell wall biosynthesis